MTYVSENLNRFKCKVNTWKKSCHDSFSPQQKYSYWGIAQRDLKRIATLFFKQHYHNTCEVFPWIKMRSISRLYILAHILLIMYMTQNVIPRRFGPLHFSPPAMKRALLRRLWRGRFKAMPGSEGWKHTPWAQTDSTATATPQSSQHP